MILMGVSTGNSEGIAFRAIDPLLPHAVRASDDVADAREGHAEESVGVAPVFDACDRDPVVGEEGFLHSFFSNSSAADTSFITRAAYFDLVTRSTIPMVSTALRKVSAAV